MNFRWQLQTFDTQIFGFKTAKITKASPTDLQALINDLNKNSIVYATYRIQANEFPMIHALEKNCFLLVDGIIALNIPIIKTSPLLNNSIHDAVPKDLPHLKKIVKNAFTVHRFYNDPAITKQKANKIYEKWTENSLNGSQADKVLVYKENNEILGFITLQKKGHIPLLAVSKKARGRGIAKKLIAHSFSLFKNWGCEIVEVETAMSNISALRTYEGSGFKIVNSFLTFRWSSIRE